VRCGARLLAGLLLAASPLLGRERIDTVDLTNGDHVSCEIIAMKSRSLHVRTVTMGTVAIEWPDVAAIASPQLFEVELTDGSRLLGSLPPPAWTGRISVATEGGTLTFPLDQVVSIVQLGKTLWQNRRGYLDFGLDYASAEEDVQVSLGAQLQLSGPRARSITTFTGSISDDVETARRERGDLQEALQFPLGRHWVLVGTGLYQRNDDLGLDSRLTASGAAIWIPRRWASGYWGFGAGLAQSEERYVGAPASTTTTAGLVDLIADYDRFGPFGTQAALDALYLPILTGPPRHRVELRASLRQKITHDFTFAVSPYYSYDSNPPNGALRHQDWGLTSSIGWTFY
jgi:hypothetical protein